MNWHPLGTIWHPLEGPGIHTLFATYLGKIPILTNIFQGGWNHQLVICNIYVFSLTDFPYPCIPRCLVYEAGSGSCSYAACPEKAKRNSEVRVEQQREVGETQQFDDVFWGIQKYWLIINNKPI